MTAAERFDPEEVAEEHGEAHLIPHGIVPLHSARLLEVPGDELARATTGSDALPYLPFCGIDGYVVEGWSHLIAAYPRTGKTELMARQVRDWIALGYDVLYITEESRPMWEFRLRHLPGDWAKLRVVFGLGVPPASLLARAFNGTEQIIVLDAVRNLLQLQDENDNSELARITNPWVARARETAKTLAAVHHMRKGSGEHGEGISGGHAILGSFDIALEVLRDPNHDRRRKVRAYCRLVTPPELAYEMNDAGDIVSLGDPKDVALGEVRERVAGILTDEWQATKEVMAGLDEPKPSAEQLRKALLSLVRDGRVDRDPPLSAGEQRGKSHHWRRHPSEVEFPPKTPTVGTALFAPSAFPVQSEVPTEPPLVGTAVGTDDAMLRAAKDAGLTHEVPL